MARRRISDYSLRYGARALGRLPEGVVRRINREPTIVDGNELHPLVQTSLRVMNGSPSARFEELPLDEARRHIDLEAWTFASSLRLARVEDFDIPTRHGDVPARLYASRTVQEPRGVFVYFHGGGWVLGSREAADSACRTAAKVSGLTVISVEYRLAPEDPFPAGLQDCIDAFRWVRDHAQTFGSRPDRVGVGGESAGGNLAAVTSLVTRDDPEGAPAFQVLFCPVVDLSQKRRSYGLFSDGFFLTEAQMDWYAAHYLSGEGRADDPLVSPLLADDLSGVAPAYVVVCGFDVLRDEGVEYANRLHEAAVPTELRNYTGLIHGFVNASGALKTARTAMQDATEWIGAVLEAPSMRGEAR